MTVLRICFVGDSLTNGTNDEECLGWPGRLCAGECAKGHDLSYYNLGIRAETSEDIEKRWRGECEPRILDIHPGALVFSFGVNDMAIADGVSTRVSMDRSVESARRMLGEAQQWLPTLWVGPMPVDDTQQPFNSAPGVSYDFSTDRLVELSKKYQTLADEMDLPYLEMLQSLVGNDDWKKSFSDGDGVHPTGAGYAMIANRIAGWSPWCALLD